VRQTLDWSGGDVDLSRSDYNGLTALHYAAAAGHINVVDLLVAALTRYRLSVDLRDQRIQRLTPYLYARHNGHTEVADALVRGITG
jgi:ankyrin repeat protein